MKPKFESPAPISREQIDKALLSGDVTTAAEALIRMAFWESDWSWAEQKSLSALTDGRKEVRVAALLSIGHLARLHRSLNLETVLPAVKSLLDDPECRGTAQDALEDIATFMGCSSA
jgi:alpha-D-ribose 1-methylphosphonate 5-triphosphate diphosphatase PhnM